MSRARGLWGTRPAARTRPKRARSDRPADNPAREEVSDYSTACIATTNFLILYLLMRLHLGKLESRTMLQMLSRLSVASLVLAGVCWAGLHFLLSNWATEPFLPKAGALALVIAAGAAAFFVCATALGISELRDITRAVKRKLLRRV